MARLTIVLLFISLVSKELSFDVNRCSSTFNVSLLLLILSKEYFRFEIYSL